MIWSSVTSRIRPGQLATFGRASRSICAIGSLTKADTGTLTANFIGTPYSLKISQSPSAVRITCSVSLSMSSSGAPVRKKNGDTIAARGMARAHQRLGADQPHGLEIDLRLVPELEPIALEHFAKRNRRLRIGVRIGA